MPKQDSTDTTPTHLVGMLVFEPEFQDTLPRTGVTKSLLVLPPPPLPPLFHVTKTRKMCFYLANEVHLRLRRVFGITEVRGSSEGSIGFRVEIHFALFFSKISN